MKPKLCLCTFLCLVATQVSATPTVALKITSNSDGLVVQPSTTVDWTISFQVSTGDNLGLALVSVDLVQNAANPIAIELTPSPSVPSALSGFARPSGFSSPPVGGSGTNPGFGGTPLGTDCEKNLYRIGGGQNTFAVAGTNVGTDTTVDGGIGQSGWQVLASGELTAPTERGVYVFSLENAVANVLTTINTGSASVVAESAVAYSPAAITIVVCPGDVEGDGDVDLSDQTLLLASYGKCKGQSGFDAACDLNGDDCVDLADLTILLTNFGSYCL